MCVCARAWVVYDHAPLQAVNMVLKVYDHNTISDVFPTLSSGY